MTRIDNHGNDRDEDECIDIVYTHGSLWLKFCSGLTCWDIGFESLELHICLSMHFCLLERGVGVGVGGCVNKHLYVKDM